MPPSTPLLLLIIQKIFPALEKWLPNLAGRLGYYLFFRPLPIQWKKNEKRMIKKAYCFNLEVNQLKANAYAWGDLKGDRIAVFMHGWSGKAAQPYQLISRLVDSGYTVYAFDAPGHGNSDSGSTSLFQFVDLLHQLQKNIGPVDLLIGHSFGVVASCNAIKSGFKTKQLVSISAPTISSDILFEFAKTIGASEITTEMMKKIIFKKFGQELHTVSVEFIAPSLPKIPILIIHDENDKRIRWLNANRMHNKLPQSKLITTHKLGHNRILNDENVSEHILKFASA